VTAQETQTAERRVLQALCQGAGGVTLLAEGARILHGCRFCDPLHQIIFETLCEIGPAAPALVRELLAAGLTRKGFPDVDLAPFFEPHGLTADAAMALVKRLRSEQTPGGD
jgi:hypothetical protein